MIGPEGLGRKAYAVQSVALTSQPLNVKNAPIVTVQNIFPRILTYYQMATLNILVQMRVQNAIQVTADWLTA